MEQSTENPYFQYFIRFPGYQEEAPMRSVAKRYTILCLWGKFIHGTEIKTGGDAVRLHLKIDKKQNVSTAHPYPWVPDTGSVMYCMPETGTKVSLYFPNEDGRNAIAVNCIRQNGTTVSIFVVEDIGLFAKKVTIRSPEVVNILRDPES